MKKIIVLLCLAIAIPAFAVVTVRYSLTDYTGGTTGCLDAVDGAVLSNGDIAYVFKDVGNYNVTSIHRLDADSGATESGISIIAPDTNPGTKRWLIVQPPYCFGTVEPTDDLGGELLWVDTTPL